MLLSLLMLVLTQDVPSLRHAESHRFTLGPDDAVLEGVGPSKTFRYEIESDDALLLVCAESNEADLVLEARIESSSTAGAVSKRAAGLITGERFETLRDDDSGGGSTPFVALARKGGGEVTIRVGAKRLASPVAASIRVFEARESEATRDRAAATQDAVRRVEDHARQGRIEEARELLRAALNELLSVDPETSFGIAEAHRALGVAAYRLQLLRETAQALEVTLRFQSRCMPESHADLLGNRGNLAATLLGLGATDRARSLLETNLDIQAKLLPSDDPRLQGTRANLALALSRLGDLEGARALQEQALVAYTATRAEDHPDVQVARANLANTTARLGDLQTARTLQEKVLEVRSRTLPAGHPHLLKSRFNLAVTLRSLGVLKRSRELLLEALAVLSETRTDADPDLQSVRLNLAYTDYELGELDAALDHFEAVWRIRSQTLPEKHPALQEAGEGLALALYKLGQVERARDLQEGVLSVRSSTLPEEHPSLQAARLNLATTLYSLGDLHRARSLLEPTLEVRSRTLPDEHPDLQSSRVNLANVIGALGDLQGARALLEKALEVELEALPPRHPRLQRARHNLAATLFELGDFHGARALEEAALSVYSQIYSDDHPDLQVARGGLARILGRLGDLEGARRLHEKVLSVCSESLAEDSLDLQSARLNVAASRYQIGDFPGARTLYEKVLEVRSRALPDFHPDLQNARSGLGATYRALGHVDRALDLYQQMLASQRQLLPSDHLDILETRLVIARLLFERKEIDASREQAREVVTALTRLLRSAQWLASPGSEVAVEKLLASALTIATGAGEFDPDPSLLRLAFELNEALRRAPMLKARLQRELGADPRARELSESLVTWTRRISDLQSEGAGTLPELVRQRDRVARELRAQLLEVKPSSILNLDHEALALSEELQPHEAAVAFWRYDDWSLMSGGPGEYSVYGCWVRRVGQALRWVSLGPAAEIDQSIQELRIAMRRGASLRATGLTGAEPGESSKGWKAAAERLASQLLDPIRAALGDADRYRIAPAGALHLVPFELLPVGDGMLGDRAQLFFTSSLSERRALSPTALSGRGLLCLGGIDYDSVLSPPSEVNVTSRGAGEFALRSGEGVLFPPLPATGAEVQTVRDLFVASEAGERSSEGSVRLLTGSKATRDAFERFAPEHRYVHLATHGWFAPESVPSRPDSGPVDAKLGFGSFSSLREQVSGLAPALLCGLAFTGANGDADQYGRVRGVMTAEEIGAMDLSGVELCVLSACETNVGLRRGGQGIASLQAALHAAGARTAITSLWKVPDEATRELMDELYRQLWILKKPKAEALWNAKQKLRSQLDEDDQPVYTVRDWAGWVLSGDPD